MMGVANLCDISGVTRMLSRFLDVNPQSLIMNDDIRVRGLETGC